MPPGDDIAKLCQSCADESASWLHFKPIYRAEFTLTDKPADLARINYERWRETVNTQRKIIAKYCKENHAQPA